MEKEDYRIGYASCYIQDHKFDHFCFLPVEAAVAWVRKTVPDVKMSMNDTKARELTIGDKKDTDALGNGWLNKLFVIVGNNHEKWIALVNWDGRFSIYVER